MKRFIGLAASLCAVVSTMIAPVSAANAQSYVLRYIMIENACYKPLRIWVNHADGWRNWHVHGPYEFSAYENAIRLSDNGTTLTQRDDHNLYVYAESLDGSSIWSGDYAVMYRGAQYNMMPVNFSIERAAFFVSFTCN